MITSTLSRVALTVTAAVLLTTAGATSASAGRRDVTAETCRNAGGSVQGSGYCVDAVGEDEWGAPIDGQAVNPHPNEWDR
ncbi:hypothetical protein [Kitasatospora aureofaciens]|uniref:hypothetical protein n=1 Tax=Kitasatospora aureofaciens TaxID=1894 RepID=UPI001C450DAF|nr:hypothetical protein [Kitasatospora aureofaciens]MBV6697698.1 hypothetical protein [Kitasatospora aureofaciens]